MTQDKFFQQQLSVGLFLTSYQRSPIKHRCNGCGRYNRGSYNNYIHSKQNWIGKLNVTNSQNGTWLP